MAEHLLNANIVSCVRHFGFFPRPVELVMLLMSTKVEITHCGVYVWLTIVCSIRWRANDQTIYANINAIDRSPPEIAQGQIH